MKEQNLIKDFFEELVEDELERKIIVKTLEEDDIKEIVKELIEEDN